MRKTSLQNKLTLNNYSSNGKQTAELFEANSGLLQMFSSALETTTNNQEVKRSLYRLPKFNDNNLPKDYIRMCLTCRSLAELFNFIDLAELQEYIYSIL